MGGIAEITLVLLTGIVTLLFHYFRYNLASLQIGIEKEAEESKGPEKSVEDIIKELSAEVKMLKEICGSGGKE